MADGRETVSGRRASPARGHRGRAGRRGRGICQRRPFWQQSAGAACRCRSTTPTSPPAPPRPTRPRAVAAARDRRGRGDAARRPAAIAESARLQRARRQADDARRPCRQDGAGQSLGDLVRALPRRNAGAGRAAEGDGRRQLRGRWRSMSTPATTRSRRNSWPRPASRRSATTATTRWRCSTMLKKRGLALGLPVTLLIDGDGCLLAHMNGPAEWSSDDAKRLIAAAGG